jgi:hypothetical protein
MTNLHQAPGIAQREERILKKIAGWRMAIVRCKEFTCLGTYSEDGKWKDSRGAILDVLEVMVEF